VRVGNLEPDHLVSIIIVKGGNMFSWLARKQNKRTKALEAYLSHFTSANLLT